MNNQILYKKIKISYSETGKGSAIILLHGFLENQRMWKDFLPELSKNYRIITIDLLGHGNTECLGYVHSMEENANMVYEVLRNLRIRKATLVGHSMGGYVALAFAEYYPQMMKGLVLLNSTSRADSDERKLNRERAIKMVKKDYTSFVRLSITNLFSEENREILLEEIEEVKKEALRTPLQGIVASLEGMKIRKNSEALLHFSNYPKLLILGKKDSVLNYNENISQIINTDVELITFPDGHMCHIENKLELTAILQAFFKKIY